MTAGPRPVQGSLYPDIIPDRPIGPILSSVQTGNNADLIARVVPLYLTGPIVVDMTYGRGGWWTSHRPPGLIAHDLHTLDGVDFRSLPEPDNYADAVTFDPPYVPSGGPPTHPNATDLRDRFGIMPTRSPEDIRLLFVAGTLEAARVVKPGGFVLTKSSDYVSGSTLTLGHVDMINAGQAAGLTVHDLIVHHTGSGPGGHNIFTPRRARRTHSYLIVFTAPSR